MKTKRKKIWLLLALVVCLTLTACSNGGSKNAGADSGGTGAAEQGGKEEQKVVTVWSWNPANEDEARPYLEAFSQAHPDIKLSFKGVTFNDYLNALKIAMVSGEGPDIFQIQPGAMMAEYAEFTEDLTPFSQKAWGDDWRDRFYEAGLKLLGTEDRLNAIPSAFAGAGYIWYNKTIFDQYDLKPPANFEEWINVSDKLKEHGVTPFIHGAKDAWVNIDMYIVLANEMAPGLVYEAEAGRVSWTDPSLVQAMDYWKQLFDKGIMQKGALGAVQYPDSKDKWVKGEAAMILLGTWNNPHMSKTFMEGVKPGLGLETDYEYLPMPFPDFNGDGQSGRLVVSTDGWAMNNGKNNKEAAWKVLEWFASPEMQKIYTDQLLLPSIKGVEMQDSDLTFDSQKAALKMETEDLDVSAGKRELDYPEIKTALADALQGVATGELTPEKAMEHVQKASGSVKR
ncbi:ABC transporter substrate-binding protein [Paenibacillaceae bacterium WGS1546]|uniref:ABC transporter substrate-binding protein n=1 Tax=Cohnella sp. WGS1546 TaxID=3366810 RepID=UPI00372D185D